MSKNTGKKHLLTSAGRRRFLANTAFASAAALLHPAGRSAEAALAAGAAAECPDVKTPLREVKGKVAFVTGGASGIGLGIVKAFVEAGMKVVSADINEKRNKEMLAQFAAANQSSQVHAIRVDVTDRPALERAAAETEKVFGKVHVLVNNAGVTIPPSLSTTSDADFSWLMNVNVTGVFNGVQVFLPRIKAHGEGGQIITTSSILGLFAGKAEGAYITSKYAVMGMMETLRAELAGTNIGASVFCPGLVQSDIGDNSRSNLPPGTQVKVDADTAAKERKTRHDPELASDPLEVGRLVLRGMRNNDLYILTHPEFEPIMQDRNAALIAAIPRDVKPTGKRANMARTMADSIYATERKRQHCSRKARVS